MALPLSRQDREQDKFGEWSDGTTAARLVLATHDPSKLFDNLKDYEYDKFVLNDAGETAIRAFAKEAI